MNDLIRLKNVENIESELSAGEIALDEAGRRLILSPGLGLSPIDLPLDVIALPERSKQPDLSHVVVFGASEPVEKLLTMGGGAPPAVDAQWRAPGCTPLAYTSQVASLRLESVIELNSPRRVLRLRTAPAGGQDVNLSFGIETMAGDLVVGFDDNANGGVIIKSCDVLLSIGRYVVFVEAEAPLAFDVLTAQRAFTASTENHPVLISYEDD